MSEGLLALEALDDTETARLTELEGVVEQGRVTFVEVGEALAAIRDERLYRHTHTAFEDYLRERWDMGRSRGYQLIDAAHTIGIVAGSVHSSGHSNGNGSQTLEIPDDFGVLDDNSGKWEQDFGGKSATWHEERRAREATTKAEAEPLPPPANESVARRLAATAKKDPERAQEVWREAVQRHGPEATAEQVAAIANGAEVMPDVGGDAKRCAAAIRRAFKAQDSGAAKQALAIWRATVYRELDRIAKGTS